MAAKGHPVAAHLDAVLDAALDHGGGDIEAMGLAALLRHLGVLAKTR